MPVRPIQQQRSNKPAGRPAGAKSFDPEVAAAFGGVIREARVVAGISQEGLALTADVERSYLGRLERGQSMPTLAVVLKLCRALNISSGEIVDKVDLATATPARRRVLRRLA